MASLFCGGHTGGGLGSGLFVAKPCADGGEPATCRGNEGVWGAGCGEADTGESFQLGCIADPEGVVNDGDGGLSGGFWHPVGRRLYFGPFHHGAFQSAVAVAGGYGLFYGGRVLYGECGVADDLKNGLAGIVGET